MFNLTVTGLTATTTYTVDIGGTSIGSILTDSTGAGTLSLSNLTTAIASGSVITVLDASSTTVLQGTFASGDGHHTGGGGGGGDCNGGGQEVSATLTGATGTSGTAEFTSSSTAGQNTFTLTVSGLSASTTYTVDIGGTSIGTFTTDTTGASTLTLSNLTTTIASASVITVVDSTGTTVLQGTFAAGDDHHGGGGDVWSTFTGGGGSGHGDGFGFSIGGRFGGSLGHF